MMGGRSSLLIAPEGIEIPFRCCRFSRYALLIAPEGIEILKFNNATRKIFVLLIAPEGIEISVLSKYQLVANNS